jgi:iron complex transport system substrate-binding protein
MGFGFATWCRKHEWLGENREQAAIDGADRDRSGRGTVPHRAYGDVGRAVDSVTMVAAPRIVSFLPSATEMACALGLGEQLLGVTHECDYPPEVKGKPVVVHSVLPIETMRQDEIDVAVTQRLRNGLGLYQVDEALMRNIAPDLILTQDLCQVCAPSGNEVSELLKVLPSKPAILWLTPKSLDQIFENIRDLGTATGRMKEAEALIVAGRARLEKIASLTRTLSYLPRVFCLEWMNPLYCSGHWVPGMVRIAGGRDELGREGKDSVRIPWADVLQWAPEVLIVMPCGLDLGRTVNQSGCLFTYPGWKDIPAVRTGRVYAVNANSYFARPGPRVIDGTELLAHLIHPDLIDWRGPPEAFRRLEDTDLSDPMRSSTTAP